MDELIAEIVADLTTELTLTDENFNSSVLEVKVKGAYRDVQSARKYPSSYTQTMIDSDMANYYSTIREVALYDYNTIGAEFQSNSSENSVTRTWISRDKLFFDVIPLAR